MVVIFLIFRATYSDYKWEMTNFVPNLNILKQNNH